MPRKTNKTATADTAALPQIPAELLEQLIPGPVTPAQLEDVFQRFKKAFIERALGAEMSQHLGYASGQAKPQGVANHRNGKSAKTVLGTPARWPSKCREIGKAASSPSSSASTSGASRASMTRSSPCTRAA